MKTSKQNVQVPHLSAAHRHTYDAIFRHPIAHDLKWRDVSSLFASLGEALEGKNGSLQVTFEGRTMTFHTQRHGGVVSADDLMTIRHFLQPHTEDAKGQAIADGLHLLVVIDHRGARVYRTERQGAVPERIEPHDPHGFGRRLHAANIETQGQRAPEKRSFYDDVVKTLHGAEQILVFGVGTGESSAMTHLLAELKSHHADLARRVIGSMAIDEHHLSEPQLLAKAREFYAQRK